MLFRRRSSLTPARSEALAGILRTPTFELVPLKSALDAPQRANAIWKRMLAEYEPPPIDPAVDEALMEFMIRRKASMPDSEV